MSLRAAGNTDPKNGDDLTTSGAWTAPLVVLFGIWLWLAFFSGGYLPRQWLPGSLALGLLGLLVTVLVIYPRRPRQLSLAVLALFAVYALVVALSAIWADSETLVWLEAARTFSLVLVFALALVFLTDRVARRWFRYLLMAAVLVLVMACVWQLWTAADISGLFVEDRLSYPVSYPNNAAALFLVAFWPLMWLASGPEERAPVRGAALGLATGLLGLAIMTQSRGAMYSLAISAVVMFVVSPSRIRTLLYLLVPAFLMVYSFPKLNRYWLEGLAAVDGFVGARTILVATVVGAFIGMVLALLERWLQISRRMKAIFGTMVLIGAAAFSIWGSVVFTSDLGGPINWLSATWRQFTGEVPAKSEAESASRYAVFSSSGRAGIWRVAWQQFTAEPALGVGADNFRFGYYRDRTKEFYKPRQAHSIQLQVLGETGLVGAVPAFGAMLLALVGLLWPRCAAGWCAARRTWLRRRPRDVPLVARSDEEEPIAAQAPETRAATSPPAVSRWGDRPIAYGWEMAILAGLAYWLVHASVDWLWQMAGVTIPALLLLAAGLASVDARADILWPRLNRWLAIPARPPASTVPVVHAATSAPARSAVPGTPALPAGPVPADGERTSRTDFFSGFRRADRHPRKKARRKKRALRKKREAARLQPPGLLSQVFRALLMTLALVVIIGAGIPYLSSLYQSSALGLAEVDGARAARRAEAARWFMPGDPGPFTTQSQIYSAAAVAAASSPLDDRAGAVLDDLALSIHSLEQAISREPADWALHYRAGIATMNLLLASDHSRGLDPGIDYDEVIPLVPGLHDWSGLRYALDGPQEAGQATDSLATTAGLQQTISPYRDMTREEKIDLALSFLEDAQERNPRGSEIGQAMEIAEGLRQSTLAPRQ